MKYENYKDSGLDKKTLRQLEKIAMDSDFTLKERGGIDGRNNDTEDFQEISIWGIQRMLEEAYKLGIRDGVKMRATYRI